MKEMTTTIVLAVLASNALFAFLQFLISRHDTQKNIEKTIKSKLSVLEKDVLRTQMLLLILMRPEEQQEIMTIGEHYFADLHGNWYMTSIFNKWLESEVIAEPEWFDGKK